MSNPSLENYDVNMLGDTSVALWAVQYVRSELIERKAEQLRNQLFSGWLK